MRKKNFKGRCEKRRLSKCEDVCRTFDAIRYGDSIDSLRKVDMSGYPDNVIFANGVYYTKNCHFK